MLSSAQLCGIIITAIIVGCISICIVTFHITDAIVSINRDICRMGSNKEDEVHTDSPFGGEM